MNMATIQRTVFKNFNSDEVSYGYRIYDDHGQSYCNTMEESDLKLSDEDFLRKSAENFDDVAQSIFEFALDHGIFVDHMWHSIQLNDDNETWSFKS